MTSPVLSVSAIEKRYATVKAVDRLSFAVDDGEIFALLGPNGAVKSTTVRMLTGIIQPDAGSIAFRLNGESDSAPARSLFGYLPEDRGLYKELPVLRTLVYFGVLRGMARRDALRAAEEWLERLDLTDRAKEKLDALSKGNQQKVQFISSILHKPRFAILDEPFSGLDPINQDAFLELLRELRANGMTILLSAHQMQLVERVADRMLLIHQGRSVLYGTLEDFRDQSTAGARVTLRVEGVPDLDALKAHPAVDAIEQNDTSDVVLLVRRDRRLSDLLVTLGTSLQVTSIHSESLSLHDIYVGAIERANSAEETSA